MTLKFDDGPHGVEASVTGAWSQEDARVIEQAGISELVLNYARGYQERTLDFLRGLRLSRLTIVSRTTKDLEPLYELADGLEGLSLTTAPNTPIDLQRLPHLKQLGADWDQIKWTIDEAPNVSDLYIGSYSDMDLRALSGLSQLKYLLLKDRPQLETLDGVEFLPQLESLRILGATKLFDLQALTSASLPRLRNISFDGCKKIDDVNATSSIQSLVRLNFGDCGLIESAKPLASLPRLEELYMHESTQIADGDLAPLLLIPSLHRLFMKSRRSYTPSLKSIQLELSARAASRS